MNRESCAVCVCGKFVQPFGKLVRIFCSNSPPLQLPYRIEIKIKFSFFFSRQNSTRRESSKKKVRKKK